MKEWFTAQELADMKLPGLAHSKRGVLDRAKRECWSEKKNKLNKPLFRARKGKGGGWEYHKSVLGADVIIELHAHLAKIEENTQKQTPVSQPLLNTKAALKRDAKIYIVSLAQKHWKDNPNLAGDVAFIDFSLRYNQRKINAHQWIYEAKPNVSARSIYRWAAEIDNGNASKLATSTRKKPRTLDTAFNGKVAEHIAGIIVAQPAIKAKQVRTLVSAEFDLNPLPSLPTFQRFIRNWKEKNAAVFESIKNPDRYKSKYRLAGENMNSHVVRLNQLWEIDASPADVLTKDGRLNLYAVVDIYSRRMLVLVSDTPKTDASLALVRRAILEWGVPEVIRTDNGADFISHQFKRALVSLGIQQEITAPFSPEKKATVERAFRTLQHDLMHLLPGYIGHNVAERKAIEERKAFAARLGERPDKAFCVDLTKTQLQTDIDSWVNNIYLHEKHRGINSTPYEMAQRWAEPVSRIENERRLDLLLSPVAGQDGFRTVTKRGIRYDTAVFIHPILHAGQRVFCRTDPTDMGRLYVFDENHDFMCVAQNAERLGIDPALAISEAKKQQSAYVAEKRAELNKAASKFKPRDFIDTLISQGKKQNSSLVSFPEKPANDHTTKDLEQAAHALGEHEDQLNEFYDEEAHQKLIQEMAEPESNVVQLEESPKQRFTRALVIEASIADGADVSAEDAIWLGGYQQSAEYRAERKMYDEYGEQYIKLENK